VFSFTFLNKRLNNMRYSPIALLVACTLATSAAHAAPNTITFEGEVAVQTCKADINGQTDAVLMLPVVSAEALNSEEKKAGLTPFTMTLTGCTAKDSNTAIKVKFQALNVSAGKNLANTAPTNSAQNVAVQLTEDEAGATPIVFGNNATATTGGVFNLEKNQDTTSHTFAAQYINDSGESAGAGAVKATVSYTLSYL